MTLEINSKNTDLKYLFTPDNKGADFTPQKAYDKVIKPDTFSKTTEDKKEESTKDDKSNNGKFDISEAHRNFIKGMISPVTAIFKHPLAALGIIGGTAAACMIIPALAPITVVGFGVLGIYQIGKGTYDAAKNYRNGKFDDAEKSFNRIGEGFVGTLLSMCGLKHGARIAREAKLMSESDVTLISQADKTAIANEVNNANKFAAIKENLSLILSGKGLKATLTQLKPKMLKARLGEFWDAIRFKRIEKEVEEVTGRKYIGQEERAKQFKATPEGVRRAALTEEQIQAEAETLAKEAFDRLGIPEDQRPNIKVITDKIEHGGGYNVSQHTISFNQETYKAGLMEIEDVIMHEATHCKEALLRAGIPQGRVDELITNELSRRIMHGENEEILVSGGFMGATMAKPPKIPAAMKSDFKEFAVNELYTKNKALNRDLHDFYIQLKYKLRENNYTIYKPEKYAELEKSLEPLINKLKDIMRKNPDFVRQYKSSDEALLALVEYSVSHNTRYIVFTCTIPCRNGNPRDLVHVKELFGEELTRAEKSLIDNIDTIEGNARIGGINGLFTDGKSFNQYQFSPEEVLAQRNGNQFLIDCINKKIQEMKSAGTLSPEDEAILLKVIEKAKLIIEYKTKGLTYYEKYKQALHNPKDEILASEIKQLEKELEELLNIISPAKYENITRLVRKMVRPDHSSAMTPSTVVYQLLDMFREEK
ncbi:hypothetical protein IKP85_01945 [bacterium]|nr:hypothetical protein [bacterium]